MSVDGDWNATIKTPMGDMKIMLSLKTEGNKLTGTRTAQDQTLEISDGKVDGNSISWITEVTTPTKMKFEFSATVDGDTISGTVRAATMGLFKFSGERA